MKRQTPSVPLRRPWKNQEERPEGCLTVRFITVNNNKSQNEKRKEGMIPMKKNSAMKKLVAAILMLAVSAASLLGSTYAWFSMNKEVSVTSMSIAAKSADPIIEISANGTNYYNDLTSGTNWTLPDATGIKLKLVTPTAVASSGGAVSWGWASSTAHDNAQKTNATTPVTLTAQTTPAQTESGRAAYLGDGTDLYVLKQTLTIRNKSYDVAGANLTIKEVKIDLSSTNTIKNAVRVLFVSDGKFAVYQPAASGSGMTLAAAGDAPWLITTGESPTATAMSVTTAGGTQAAGLPIIASTLAANGGSATVDVYMYFDGTDDDAYTDLATDLSAVSAEFTFAID